MKAIKKSDNARPCNEREFSTELFINNIVRLYSNLIKTMLLKCLVVCHGS